jgi:hypothetical protein
LNKAKAENVHHPARILASEGNFDRLYDLLDYGNDIGRQVWELMNLLPTNQKILQQFRSVGTCPPPCPLPIALTSR